MYFWNLQKDGTPTQQTDLIHILYCFSLGFNFLAKFLITQLPQGLHQGNLKD